MLYTLFRLSLYVGVPLLTRKIVGKACSSGGDPIGLASEAALQGCAIQGGAPGSLLRECS
jgi:hypothetical protein